VTDGGSGSNLGIGIIVGLLVVAVALALIWFFTSGSDDGGIDLPDTLELDVDVDSDGADGADGADGTDGADGEDAARTAEVVTGWSVTDRPPRFVSPGTRWHPGRPVGVPALTDRPGVHLARRARGRTDRGATAPQEHRP
jgi:hypothetical protein